jgi:hypothetical protein
MTQMTHASWGVRHLRHADGAAIDENSAKPDGDSESRCVGATISWRRLMRALRPFTPD